MADIKIIYQDDCILVLNKPPNLVVDKSQTQATDTLEDWLQQNSHPVLDTGSINSIDSREFTPYLIRGGNDRLERGGIVHRLDKDTSGIILIAKTQKTLDNLQNQFKDRVVKKEYLALVHGFLETKGIVEASIIRNPKNREKFVVASQGDAWEAREAVTEYEPLERLQFTGNRLQEIFPDFNKIQMRKLEKQKYGEFTLLRCKPKTGRTHQIRVHLKYINHPIVSDEKYAGRKMNRLDRRWCPRQFLHAAKIGFNHPVSGEWMELESGLPEDLKKAMVVLDSPAKPDRSNNNILFFE